MKVEAHLEIIKKVVAGGLPTFPGEEWRYVKGHSKGYSVSSLGRIVSFKKDCIRLLTPVENYSGYHLVGLYLKGKNISTRLHRVVATAFLGESKLQVNHKNGVKSDNRVSNLEWVTAKENSNHSIRMGLGKSGESHYRTKLSDKQVLKIRSSKESQKYLSEKYGISTTHVWHIRTGKSRKNV